MRPSVNVPPASPSNYGAYSACAELNHLALKFPHISHPGGTQDEAGLVLSAYTRNLRACTPCLTSCYYKGVVEVEEEGKGGGGHNITSSLEQGDLKGERVSNTD